MFETEAIRKEYALARRAAVPPSDGFLKNLIDGLETNRGVCARFATALTTLEALTARIRRGEQHLRQQVPEHATTVQNTAKLLRGYLLYGLCRGDSAYGDFLFLMRLFLLGIVPISPVAVGSLSAETACILQHLVTMNHNGITTWESQPSGMDEDTGHGVTVRQYAFVEMSGPSSIMRVLEGKLANTQAVHLFKPGASGGAALKIALSRSDAALEELRASARGYTPSGITTRGSAWCVDMFFRVRNDAKYLTRAIEAVKELDGAIGDHRYVFAVSTDPDHATDLFDKIVACLDRTLGA